MSKEEVSSPQVKKAARGRNCEIVSNVSSLAKQFGCNESEVVEELKKRLKSYKSIEKYAMIIHNKDVDDLGLPEATHVHVVVVFKSDTIYKTAASMLGIPDQCVEKIKSKRLYGDRKVADVGGALLYLTHRNAPDKYQYDDSDVIASDGWDWKKQRDQSAKNSLADSLGKILELIKEGIVTESNITQLVGMDVYVEHAQKIELAFKYQEKSRLMKHNRSMIVIYIQGDKGSGKTTLAKDFCERKDLSYHITGGGNDPFQGYAKQDAIIIDDARPGMFEPEEWLKILDNNTVSLARSRYHNKMLNAKFIILTSTHNLMNFFSCFPDEDPKQLYRRIKLWMIVSKHFIDIYEYKADEGHYSKIQTSRNWIEDKFGSSNLTTDEKTDLLDGFGLLNSIPFDDPNLPF